jgi:glycerophosphoryl diester phosphodiesterase
VPPIVIAHRTCPRDAPENSLEGIAKALELGADGVEFDLRISLDQKPYLLHDWSLHRTTGFWPPIEITPSSVVERLRLFGSSETVPSLAMALEAVDPRLLIAVDVKTPWSVFSLVREVRRLGLQSRVLVWCTSALDLRYLRRALPGVETAYLRNDKDPAAKLAYLAQASQLGAKAVSADWDAIDAKFVMNAHDLGLKVYSWHAEQPLYKERLASGLDGLVTDYPVEARQAIEAALSDAGARRAE